MSDRAKILVAVAGGAITIFLLTLVVGQDGSIGLVSVIEFLFITGVLFLLVKYLLKRPVNPLLVVVPFVLVAFISLSAGGSQ